MNKVTIDRELLERIDESAICDGTDATISDSLFTELVAAPQQPKQDVVGAVTGEDEMLSDALADIATHDKK